MIPIVDPHSKKPNYEKLINHLFKDLSEKIKEGEVDSNAENIQRVVQYLIAQFRDVLDSHPKAKQDFMNTGIYLERWGPTVLDPLTNVAKNHFKKILFAQNKQQENDLVREKFRKEIDLLNEKKEKLLLYINEQRSLVRGTSDPDVKDRYFDDL